MKYRQISDQIYITGLPKSVTEEQISSFFGGIGRIKLDKRKGTPMIWIYKDKVTGEPKGDATVTYDDPETAPAAIEWFDNKEFLGSIVHVEMSQCKDKGLPGRGRGRGRGRSRGGGRESYEPSYHGDSYRDREPNDGGFDANAPKPNFARDGDWPCKSCGNVNFKWRKNCNMCGTMRPGHYFGGTAGAAGGHPSREGTGRSFSGEGEYDGRRREDDRRSKRPTPY